MLHTAHLESETEGVCHSLGYIFPSPQLRTHTLRLMFSTPFVSMGHLACLEHILLLLCHLMSALHECRERREVSQAQYIIFIGTVKCVWCVQYPTAYPSFVVAAWSLKKCTASWSWPSLPGDLEFTTFDRAEARAPGATQDHQTVNHQPPLTLFYFPHFPWRAHIDS